MKNLWNSNRSTKLLIAATVVAALRMMLIHAVFIGFDVKQWPLFAVAEVWSGLAYAVLEGVALAYVSRRWRRLNPATPVEWVYWGILALGMLVLLASIVWVTALAATSVRQDVGIDALLNDGGVLVWSMLVAALNPLMVILIGIVEDEDDATPPPAPPAVQRAWVEAIAAEWRGPGLPPATWLRSEYLARTGAALPHAVADEVVLRRGGGAVRGDTPALPEAVTPPDDEVERLLDAVGRAERLGPEHRRLVEALREQGLTWPQVAERCDASETTVQRWAKLETNGYQN